MPNGSIKLLESHFSCLYLRLECWALPWHTKDNGIEEFSLNLRSFHPSFNGWRGLDSVLTGPRFGSLRALLLPTAHPQPKHDTISHLEGNDFHQANSSISIEFLIYDLSNCPKSTRPYLVFLSFQRLHTRLTIALQGFLSELYAIHVSIRLLICHQRKRCIFYWTYLRYWRTYSNTLKKNQIW